MVLIVDTMYMYLQYALSSTTAEGTPQTYNTASGISSILAFL